MLQKVWKRSRRDLESPTPSRSCVLVCREVLVPTGSHTLNCKRFYSLQSGGIFSSFGFQRFDSPSHRCPCCLLSHRTEENSDSFFVLEGSLGGQVMVVSPFLVKAAAQEGAMEMGVILFFALNMSEWKSSRLISIFPMLQSCSIFMPLSEKHGKLKMSGISRWLKRIQNHVLVLVFN